ncbi:MAG: formamidopyrimidine-DNA glycosylase [Polyangiales bacterium]|jgi:formamidopyrimidine-DNA glycosylase
MPELPEVEIAKRFAEHHLLGRVFRAEVIDDEAPRTSKEEFIRATHGRRVASFERYGKNLFLLLDRGVMGLHLGMSGKLLWRRTAAPLPPHTRAAFHTDSGFVAFVDVRRFGHIDAGSREDVFERAKVASLGPDALSIDGPKSFRRALGQSRSAIKTRLMNQARIAGLGNIQACEALFRARIDPRALTSVLDESQVLALYTGMMESIEHTLRTTPGDEVQYMSDGAHVANPFLVYGREKESCGRCKSPIQRFPQSGRSTFWCPRCQSQEAS